MASGPKPPASRGPISSVARQEMAKLAMLRNPVISTMVANGADVLVGGNMQVHDTSRTLGLFYNPTTSESSLIATDGVTGEIIHRMDMKGGNPAQMDIDYKLAQVFIEEIELSLALADNTTPSFTTASNKIKPEAALKRLERSVEAKRALYRERFGHDFGDTPTRDLTHYRKALAELQGYPDLLGHLLQADELATELQLDLQVQTFDVNTPAPDLKGTIKGKGVMIHLAGGDVVPGLPGTWTVVAQPAGSRAGMSMMITQAPKDPQTLCNYLASNAFLSEALLHQNKTFDFNALAKEAEQTLQATVFKKDSGRRVFSEAEALFMLQFINARLDQIYSGQRLSFLDVPITEKPHSGLASRITPAANIALG